MFFFFGESVNCIIVMSSRKSKSIYAENTWIALVHITSICAMQIADNCGLHQTARDSDCNVLSSGRVQRLEIEIDALEEFFLTSTISDRSRSLRSN